MTDKRREEALMEAALWDFLRVVSEDLAPQYAQDLHTLVADALLAARQQGEHAVREALNLRYTRWPEDRLTKEAVQIACPEGGWWLVTTKDRCTPAQWWALTGEGRPDDGE